MTENVIGLWKRRFPILKGGIGTKVHFTCDVIVATCVLHNIALLWNEDEPDDSSDESSESESRDDEELVPVHDGRPEVRAVGQAHRDWLSRNFC